ncbi:MAG TPA: S9 family peptidase [Xanthobacteraceae bacterium]|nr:S9 family peptidase [Xanthobacteraceae bacterium]
MRERPSLPPAPAAEQRPLTTNWHGTSLADEFAWLKAENWQEVLRAPERLDPAIRAYLEAENAYAEAALAHTKALQDELHAEMKGRIKQDDGSVPAPDGEFAYFTRYREGGQHPMICRCASDGSTEEVLLDGDQLAQGQAFFQLGATHHSPDHRMLAWEADISGAEFFTLRLRDLTARRDLDDTITETSGWSTVWTRDASAFYYIRLDDNHRPSRVFRHRLGTPAEDDLLVFEETDPAYFVSISRMQSGAFAEILASDHETSECWLLDLGDPDAAPQPVAGREHAVLYDVEHHPSLDRAPSLVIRTNADGCEDFRLVLAPLSEPSRKNWREFVPYRPGVYLITFTVFRNWLVRLEREEGLPRIVVRSLENGEEHTISFAEEAYSLGIEPGYEFATDILRFNYSSMTTPSEVWDYNLVSRERTLRKRQEIPSGHNPSAYVTRRLWAPAPDGETVPISMLYRKDLAHNGDAPCLLYGYGAYGMAMPPAFSANRLSLVDRGFVYAIAHVRGGAEKGWRWYRTGKLLHKQNTFTDFIAAAEHLIATGWTRAGRIVAHGGSAGGLLMGAVANMRPDLFAAVIAEVPFVDTLNTILDGALPLTPPEWPEWGNPITDPEAFRTILAYSPYDNVKAQNYPPILAMTGLSDPRVLYWEPAKWVARLRARKTDDNLVALRINMDAGHAGASGRFDRLKEVALVYAFAIEATKSRAA